MRGNRHEITKYGWLHDQDNSKVIRESDKKDVILANEKGYNTYIKVTDEKCKAAQEWWQKNNKKWELVRNKWSEVYGRNQNLSLKNKVNNKFLYKYLFSDDYQTKKQIDEIIEKFIIKK